MWFKKKSQISGYNSNTAYDGTDWRRTNGNSYSGTPSLTLPSAADANNYFYLPALGYYESGKLYELGRLGHYWSSSAAPLFYGSNAYYLGFLNGLVRVYDDYRTTGYRVDPLFE